MTDSAAAATALFCGVKTNYETSGVDSSVHLADCQAALNETHHAHSILKWAQDAGMATGFVTTTRVVHATPSALYAHSADRRWECEAKMKEITRKRGCKDIARQLVEDSPGRNINVVMGGGRQCLVANVTGTKADPVDTWSCYSSDGRDLIHDWAVRKRQAKKRHAVAQNTEQLKEIDPESVDYLLGKFQSLDRRLFRPQTLFELSRDLRQRPLEVRGRARQGAERNALADRDDRQGAAPAEEGPEGLRAGRRGRHDRPGAPPRVGEARPVRGVGAGRRRR